MTAPDSKTDMLPAAALGSYLTCHCHVDVSITSFSFVTSVSFCLCMFMVSPCNSLSSQYDKT